MYDSTDVPSVYPNIYTDDIDDYLLVYNPLSEKGVTVLNRESRFIFSQIDNKRTLDDIVALAKKEDPKIRFRHINRIFKDFFSAEVIYFDSPKLKVKKQSKQLGVWLHITNQCNLRCTYCYVQKTNEKMTDKTAYLAMDKVFQSAKKHGFGKINFKFSGGEALLELDKIINLVHRAKRLGKKHHIQVDFVVLTNGIFLTKKVVRRLKENNLRVSVSLDGLAQYHDQTRVFANGQGSFKYVEIAIENLHKAGVLYNVSVTVSSRNIEGLPGLTKYLLARNIIFNFNFYRENPYVKEQLEVDTKKLIASLKKAYRLIYENPPPYSVINGLLDRVFFKKPHLFACGMGNSYIVVRHDGRIVSCQNLLTLQPPIGSIGDNDLVEVIEKGNFVRPRGLTIEQKTPCRDCQWKYICCGGCPLLTFQQKGRYDVNSPYCGVYKALIPEVLRLEARRLIKYGS